MSLRDDPTLRDAPTIHGYRVLEPCVLLDTLGKGGMGTVYRGWHLNLGVQAAVKCLHHMGSDAASVARFRAEASILASLSHESLVRVFDVRERAGLHYIVMEFVDGESAADRVKRLGPLPPADACQIALRTALGLSAAHRKNIIHRDIKPDNILLSRAGEVKLADLGIAKFTRSDDALNTQSQMLMGTPHYMSPEQWQGAKLVKPHSDVYALGVTLYTLLTGDIPFQAESLMGIAQLVCKQGLADLREIMPGVPDEVAVLVRESTAINPQARPADADALATRLARVLEHLDDEPSLADDTVASRIDGTIRPGDDELDAIRSTLNQLATSPTEGTYPATLDQSQSPPNQPAQQARRPRAAIALLGVLALALLAGGVGWAGGWFTPADEPPIDPDPSSSRTNDDAHTTARPDPSQDPVDLLDSALSAQNWKQAANLLTLDRVRTQLDTAGALDRIELLNEGLVRAIELDPDQWLPVRASIIELTPRWPVQLAPLLANGLGTEPPDLDRAIAFIAPMRQASLDPSTADSARGPIDELVRTHADALLAGLTIQREHWQSPEIRSGLEWAYGDGARSPAAGTLLLDGLARIGPLNNGEILPEFAARATELLNAGVLESIAAAATATMLIDRVRRPGLAAGWFTPGVESALSQLQDLRNIDNQPCLAATALLVTGRITDRPITCERLPALTEQLGRITGAEHGIAPDESLMLAQTLVQRAQDEGLLDQADCWAQLEPAMSVLATPEFNIALASAALARAQGLQLADSPPAPDEAQRLATWADHLARARQANHIIDSQAETLIEGVMDALRDRYHSDHYASFPGVPYGKDQEPKKPLIDLPESIRGVVRTIADNGSPSARLALFESLVWYQLKVADTTLDRLTFAEDHEAQTVFKLIEWLDHPHAVIYQAEMHMVYELNKRKPETRVAIIRRGLETLSESSLAPEIVAHAQVRLGELWMESEYLKKTVPDDQERYIKGMDYFQQSRSKGSMRGQFWYTLNAPASDAERIRAMKQLADEGWQQAVQLQSIPDWWTKD